MRVMELDLLRKKDKMKELEKKIPFTNGTPGLDSKFGRYDYGIFRLILGESGHGKTTYSFFEAEANYKLGHKIAYFSLEMPRKSLIIQKSRAKAGISKEQWNDKNISETQKQLFLNEFNRLDSLPFLLNITEPDIKYETILKYMYDQYRDGVRLFYLDNLGFLVPTKETKEIDFQAKASRELKEICNSWGVSINLLHHFNKGSDKERGKSRGLGAIRGSGKLENDADLIVSIFRQYDPDEEVNNLSDIILLKDRIFGQPSKATVEFIQGTFHDRKEPDNTFSGVPLRKHETESRF